MILKEMISLNRKFLGRAIQLGVRNFSKSQALWKTHYEALGVKPDATQAEIKNAYFELSKVYHPDRIAATDENLAKFREISNAYEVLGNEQSRKLYDRGLFDIKGAGLEVDEVDDPIVKFYKQKQDLGKVVKTQAEEMDAWTRTYYREARQKVLKKHEFFSESKKAFEEEENVIAHNFVLVSVCTLVGIMFFSNFEHNMFYKLKRKYFHL